VPTLLLKAEEFVIKNTTAFNSQQQFPHIANFTFSLDIFFYGKQSKSSHLSASALVIVFFFFVCYKKHYGRSKRSQSISSHFSWFLPFFIGWRTLPVEGIDDEEDDSVVETGGVSCCKVPAAVQ